MGSLLPGAIRVLGQWLYATEGVVHYSVVRLIGTDGEDDVTHHGAFLWVCAMECMCLSTPTICEIKSARVHLTAVEKTQTWLYKIKSGQGKLIMHFVGMSVCVGWEKIGDQVHLARLQHIATFSPTTRGRWQPRGHSIRWSCSYEKVHTAYHVTTTIHYNSTGTEDCTNKLYAAFFLRGGKHCS